MSSDVYFDLAKSPVVIGEVERKKEKYLKGSDG